MDIMIQGAKLRILTDFKMWLGIILAFSTYAYSNQTIRLHNSLFSISSVTLAFSSKGGKKTMFSPFATRDAEHEHEHEHEHGYCGDNGGQQSLGALPLRSQSATGPKGDV
ncbi:hypothetical protein [Pantoea vagans]|uniref:hypothetical protein n=1 Tax=Pantoea vagans TaxID=470934 RepID=UPI003016C706